MKKIFLLSLFGIASCLYSHPTTNGFFMGANLLIWQIREVGADNWAQVIQEPGVYQQVQLLDAPFKWKPGFRLDIGYDSHYDLWDILFSYTWYRTNAALLTNQTSSFVYSSFLGNFFINNTNGAKISGPVYRAASINWDVLFNTFDLELGRTFKTDEFLTVRPFIGLKGGVVNQRINTNWKTPFAKDVFDQLVPLTTFSSATEAIKNNFGGAGPLAGINTSWIFYTTYRHSCSIFGNFSGALLGGRWHLKDLYQNNAPQSVAIINDSLTTALTMVRGNLGIGWDALINDFMLTLSLSYESQVWFNMLRFYSLNGGRPNNLLSLQGAVFELGINF